MKDIFVSYKKQDVDRVRILVQALEREGFSVWWDPTIPPGSSWAQVIEGAIESCRVIVVVWSHLSAKSEWVHKEARKGESRHILVPVVIDDVEIPFEFEHIQGARLVGWDGTERNEQFDQLVGQIRRRIEASPDVGDRAAEAEARRHRRGAALRSLRAQRVGAGLSLPLFVGLLAGYLLTPADTADLRLRNLELSGVSFTLPGSGADGPRITGGSASDSTILALDELPLDDIVVFGLASAQIPAAGGGAPRHFDDDPLVMLETAGDQSLMNLSALRLAPGARVELQRLATSQQMAIHGAAAELGVNLSGPIVVYVEHSDAKEEDTLNLQVPGRVALRPDPDRLTMEFEPVTDDVALFENLAIAQLRLYRVDQDVSLESTELSLISTVRSGTLTADWLGEPRQLTEGEGLRVASFDGEILRLGLTGTGVVLNADGRVTGLRSGLGREGEGLMPSHFLALGGIARWLILAGAVVGFALLGYVNLRLWRRAI